MKNSFAIIIRIIRIIIRIKDKYSRKRITGTSGIDGYFYPMVVFQNIVVYL